MDIKFSQWYSISDYNWNDVNEVPYRIDTDDREKLVMKKLNEEQLKDYLSLLDENIQEYKQFGYCLACKNYGLPNIGLLESKCTLELAILNETLNSTTTIPCEFTYKINEKRDLGIIPRIRNFPQIDIITKIEIIGNYESASLNLRFMNFVNKFERIDFEYDECCVPIIKSNADHYIDIVPKPNVDNTISIVFTGHNIMNSYIRGSLFNWHYIVLHGKQYRYTISGIQEII